MFVEQPLSLPESAKKKLKQKILEVDICEAVRLKLRCYRSTCICVSAGAGPEGPSAETFSCDRLVVVAEEVVEEVVEEVLETEVVVTEEEETDRIIDGDGGGGTSREQ